MARSARPGSSAQATKVARKLDDLAALRQAVRAHNTDISGRPGADKPAASAASTPAPAVSSPPEISAPDAANTQSLADGDDSALFRAAVRDVAPLPRDNRVELSRPGPPPVPRQRTDTSETPATAEHREIRTPADDGLLFQASMQDVTPLRTADRYQGARAREKTGARVRSRDRQGVGHAPDEWPAVLPADLEGLPPEELFRIAVRGVRPIDDPNRAELDMPQARPEPTKRCEDEQAALRETLEAPLSLEDRMEMGDEASFLRPGLPRRVLTDLRRGRWILQSELDLHGLNREEARLALAEFLGNCLLRGHRCIRVIHGKGLGSPGKESILKRLSRGWLAQREEILAFCQANPYQGGSGALMVLLRGPNPPRG